MVARLEETVAVLALPQVEPVALYLQLAQHLQCRKTVQQVVTQAMAAPQPTRPATPVVTLTLPVPVVVVVLATRTRPATGHLVLVVRPMQQQVVPHPVVSLESQVYLHLQAQAWPVVLVQVVVLTLVRPHAVATVEIPVPVVVAVLVEQTMDQTPVVALVDPVKPSSSLRKRKGDNGKRTLQQGPRRLHDWRHQHVRQRHSMHPG